jgi:hypothetical protein
MPKNFARVEQNIYRGGAPSLRDLQMLVSVYGIKRVISLDDTVGAQIAPYLKQMKVEHIRIPINPGATTVTDPLNNLMRNITTLLTAKQPVYIHCLHGQDRTGFAIALFRVLHDGWGCDQALNEARRFGYGNGLAPAVQSLYKQLLCGLKGKTNISTDVAEADDIVSNMRDEVSAANQTRPLAMNPQQSFAPEIDLDNFGQTSSEGERSSDARERKRKLRLEVLRDIDQNLIPMVGEYGNSGPIQGAGPVENSGALQFM